MLFKEKEIKIAVIGLGYVGLPLAIELAKNFKVFGYDIKKKRVEDIICNLDKNDEVDTKKLKKTKALFSFKENILENANIFIITVPTEVDKNNLPDLSLLKDSTKTVSKYLKKKSIIIYESTVYPGCTEEVCLPILKRNRKFRYNKNFFIGYSPERINPGDKKRNISNISKVVSGSSERSLEQIKFIYSKIVKRGVYAAPSIKIAEAAKAIENTQRDLNIGFMNELYMFFNKINIPTDEVLKAAGTKWNFLNFSPGLVGGHCIGIDPYYLIKKFKEVNINPNIILSGRKTNNNFHEYIAEKAIKIIKKKRLKKKILILGYSFKENCKDYRNTRVNYLIKYFRKKKYDINIHDPYILENIENFPYKKSAIYNLNRYKNKFDLIILAVPHKAYLKSQNKIIKMLSPKGYLYDFKSTFRKNKRIIQN